MRMKECFVGESFPQKFVITLDSDSEVRVDSGEFEVYLDDILMQSGTLAIDEDGHTVSFRFSATAPGVHEIRLTWRIGDDLWKQPFLMRVKPL